MPPFTLGRLIALLVLIAAFVLALAGRMGTLEAGLFIALAVAILVP